MAAQRALAEVSTIFEAKQESDTIEAIRLYAKLSKDRGVELTATEFRLRADRRIGEMLAGIQLHQGGRPPKKQVGDTSWFSDLPTLADLGLTKDDAVRARKAAAVPAAEFERRIAVWREGELRREARMVASLFKAVTRPVAPRETPPLPPGSYRLISADPAYPYHAYSEAGMDRSPENHYATMSIAEICALPVADLAAPDCVLLLWTPNMLVPAALSIMDAWGFKFATTGFVWVKTGPFGLGYWARQRSELCLLGTRGAPKRLAADVDQVIEAERGRHSAKPDEFYARVERLVAGPYIELFARKRRPGWDCWGDEIAEDGGDD
jgi:N6-adenosine-specific RNA methylase IME4